MADEKRRDFLKTKLGSAVAFGVGLAAGGAAGAGAMRARQNALRHPFEADRVWSYAQQGEDIILFHILYQVLGLRPITYMDVGAHHPVAHNNTFFLYELGNEGVLVEPNPALWNVLASVRPRDALVRGGIGIDGKDSEADYYVINDNGELNTFSKEMAESYPARTGGRFRVREVLRLPLLDINRLMEKHWKGAPHLLSVDTEGFELPILRSIDWKRYRPKVVCVDTLEVATRRQRTPILEFMVKQGYDVRGGTFVNTIFVDRALIQGQ